MMLGMLLPSSKEGDHKSMSEVATKRLTAPPARIRTGVKGLDAITSGGLLRGYVYLLEGIPGSGKTTLANQIGFHHALEDGRVLFVSLLSESVSSLLSQLKNFQFFEEKVIGGTLHYINAYNFLEEGGIKLLQDSLMEEMNRLKITLLILDGLHVVESLASSKTEFQRFVHRVQSFANLSRCTVIIVNPPSLENDYTLATIVDGIFKLTNQFVAQRCILQFECSKMRGTAHVRGLSTYEITETGISIYLRKELFWKHSPELPSVNSGEKLRFGIPYLDEMLHGGLRSESTTLLLGPPGVGKTIFSTYFLTEGAKKNEKCLYFGFNENPNRLLLRSHEIHNDMEPFTSKGLIQIHWQPPVDLMLDSVGENLIRMIQEQNIQRLVIDGTLNLRRIAIYPQRFTAFMASLCHELHSLGVTTILIEETDLFSTKINPRNEDLTGYIENVIFLRYVEIRSQLRRLVSIIKSRDSEHDLAIREFQIGHSGIEIMAPFESAEAIFTGFGKTSRKAA
jgi:circadian clock protein KaiC